MENLYIRLAAAYVRGKTASQPISGQTPLPPLDSLSDSEMEILISKGRKNGLPLHRFKITMGLPRVKKVLGILHGLQPQNILDIGTGRGVFLWPLIHEFPGIPVHCLDLLDYRVADINAVHAGGVTQVSAQNLDITNTGFEDGAYDGITFLETLEHIPDTRAAIREAVRIARRFIIISVPSKPDENPEHIHLFSTETLRSLLAEQGITTVKFDSVLNHIIALALK
ncbi:MAG: class I SAM-dependent methyltransferase [Bacteroidia bacterium]